jgi:hypothetical protein
MPFLRFRAVLLSAGALFAIAACNGTGAVTPPAAASLGGSAADDAAASPADTTSILKLLKKDVVIGSTVDPKNGDMGPRAISMAGATFGEFKKGDLLVCNFDDSSGKAGAGTTIELFEPKPGSKPTTFAQSSDLQGCDGDAISTVNEYVYATGLTSKLVAEISPDGKIKKTYGSPIVEPIGDGYAPPIALYASNFIFAGDAKTGAVNSLDLGVVSARGYGSPMSVVTGFAVNDKPGWKALGPTGFAYNKKPKIDTLYVVDGACNTVVAIRGASSLLLKDEITVQKGCKTFKCKYKTPCGKVVLSGKPLDKPEAEAFLPNGNLIVANTAGGNTLVEMTPTGQVLDTKVVDKSKGQGVFGLLAIGKTDSDTALFYTDTNDNSLHELEQ